MTSPVMPMPVPAVHWPEPMPLVGGGSVSAATYYTADQLRARDEAWQARLVEAVQAEREACALATEMEHIGSSVEDACDDASDAGYNTALRHAAAAIRARP